MGKAWFANHNDVIKKSLDNRTEDQFLRNYQRCKAAEKKIMSALLTEYMARGVPIEEISYEEVDPDEYAFDNRSHTVPDYFFYLKQKTFTYEIKYLRHDPKKDILYIKCPAIISMAKNPHKFPNGHLIVARDNNFAIMKAQIVGRHPIEVIEGFSASGFPKKGFAIPMDELNFRSWISPHDFSA